jgi:hypothetical protein
MSNPLKVGKHSSFFISYFENFIFFTKVDTFVKDMDKSGK